MRIDCRETQDHQRRLVVGLGQVNEHRGGEDADRVESETSEKFTSTMSHRSVA